MQCQNDRGINLSSKTNKRIALWKRRFILSLWLIIIACEDPIITHHGVVIGDETKARKHQKKTIYDCLNKWMDEWGYNDGSLLEDAFNITYEGNRIKVETEASDLIYCDIEVVEEL